MLFRRPVQPLPDGAYKLRLRDDEREAVARLVEELRALVVFRDPDAARLFPPAHRDDPVAAAEFEELVRDSLEEERMEALATVERTLRADRLAEAEAAAWCGVLNDGRLILGERLGVTEELYDKGISPRDPRAAELAYYGWLTWLQGELVEALASRL